MTTQSTGDTGSAARLLIEQMQRERRSFWGILGVFFLLLAGIGGMIVYQMLALRTFTEDSRARRFQEIGEQSLALSQLRSQQNDGAIAQREALNQMVEAQRMITMASRASRTTSSDSLVAAAVDLAKDHFLGRSLNQSSATVVAVALDSRRLSSAQRALLNAALNDWIMPENDATKPDLDADLPKVNAYAQALRTDPKLAYFGHAAVASHRFRQANSGAVYMDWDNGCKELVEAATSALSIMDPAAEESADPEAAGLNLHYWRGQCWRRHGEPEKALQEFEQMMRLAKSDALSPSNPLKYQAYHGMGTVMTTLLDPNAKPDERAKYVAEALSYLQNAGEFRVRAGMTEVGRVNSTGNIGFLLLKENTAEGLVKTLEHTGAVDEVQASTWNLVAELTAVRALQKQGLPAQFSSEDLKAKERALREKYSSEALDEIAFRTLAKLAYQGRSSLPKTELSKILDEAHHPALEEAAACIGQRLACYRDVYRKT